MTGKRWKGELARPIRPTVIRPPGMSVINPETIKQINETMVRLHDEEVERQFEHKLRLLMDHYSISDTGDWRELSLKLAVDFVPGFQVEAQIKTVTHTGPVMLDGQKKVGRRAEWTLERLYQLSKSVEEVKMQHRLKSDRGALEFLMRSKKWERPKNHRGDRKSWLETLESRLQDGKALERDIAGYMQQLADIAREIKAENSENSEPI
jgi:ribosomal protein S17E